MDTPYLFSIYQCFSAGVEKNLKKSVENVWWLSQVGIPLHPLSKR